MKFAFGPGPHWGSLQHSPNPLAGLRGPASKGKGREMEGRKEEREKEEGRKRREGEEWKGKGRPANTNSWIRP